MSKTVTSLPLGSEVCLPPRGAQSKQLECSVHQHGCPRTFMVSAVHFPKWKYGPVFSAISRVGTFGITRVMNRLLKQQMCKHIEWMDNVILDHSQPMILTITKEQHLVCKSCCKIAFPCKTNSSELHASQARNWVMAYNVFSKQ